MSTFMVQSSAGAPPSLRYFPITPFSFNPPAFPSYVASSEQLIASRGMTPTTLNSALAGQRVTIGMNGQGTRRLGM